MTAFKIPARHKHGPLCVSLQDRLVTHLWDYWLTTLTLLTICFTAIGQTFSTKKSLTFYPGTYIDTEYRYTDSTGIDVIVQNSLRKGGQYIDPTGKDFFSVIYWYRVINETATPLELTINFPADSFATSPSPDSYLKAFLPLDTWHLAKKDYMPTVQRV